TATRRAFSIPSVRDDVAIAMISAPSRALDLDAPRRAGSGLKRCVDLIAASAVLIVAAPLIALIALAIKVESRGPVFFPHRRLGRNGRLFNCWKFRSMHVDAEMRLRADAELRHQYVSNHFKIPRHLDPRITRLGHFLRRSSLDELPQIFNVLRGEMSLVGP